MINNPYIEKVSSHPHILIDTDTIYSNQWNWENYFQNKNDITLEIWTGLWNFFSREVQNNQNSNFIWMEIKYKRLFICAEKALWNLNNYAWSTRPKNIFQRIEKQSQWEGITHPNFVLVKDFWENIDKIFTQWEIKKTYILFPDPWARKKRWLKNRLLQTQFFNKLYKITQNEWSVIIKTDHLEYFEFACEQLTETDWKIEKKSYNWEQENDFCNTETTEFQQLFRGKKIKINYLELKK